MKIPDKLKMIKLEHPEAAELAAEFAKILPPKALIGQEDSSEIAMLSKALVAVANQTWRVTSAILDPESNEVKCELSTQEIKKVSNALEGIKEALGGIGIKIIDRLGEPFNAGLPEQVVTEEAQEGISKEQIIRTIRPTLMWHQTMVQRGEIDIAVPAAKN